VLHRVARENNRFPSVQVGALILAPLSSFYEGPRDPARRGYVFGVFLFSSG